MCVNIEEKSKAIWKFCCAVGCTDCPVYEIEEIANGKENCFSLDGELPVNIERNYKLIFGTEAETDNDVVNHPAHYTQGGIECIDAMKAAFGADELAVYCKIAAFKYIWRCEHKNGLEDIKKAVWYLEKYIDLKGETEDADNGT